MSAKGTHRQLLKDVGAYADLGFRFAIAVALGSYLGYWADNKLSTSPLFIILGVLLGATSGFVTIYRAVYPDSKRRKKNNGETT